jgi:hypothetical protein
VEQLVVEAQDSACLVGGIQGAVIAAAVDVFEHFVNIGAADEHGVVGVSRAKEVGQWEVLCGQGKLDLVGEGNLGEVVLALGSSFEEELASLGLDDGFWRPAGAAGEFVYGLNYANVIMTKAYGQFFSSETFTICAYVHNDSQ